MTAFVYYRLHKQMTSANFLILGAQALLAVKYSCPHWILDPGVCIEEPILVCRLGVGVQGPHLGRVLLLGGHVQLHCVAVLGKSRNRLRVVAGVQSEAL